MRHAAPIIVALLLGAVTNLAVAWLCVLRWQGGTTWVSGRFSPSAARWEWLTRDDKGNDVPASPPRAVLLPDAYSGLEHPGLADARIGIISAGFPLRSSAATVVFDGFGPTQTVGIAGGVWLHELPGWAVSFIVTHVMNFEHLAGVPLPHHPLWRGVVVNTLLYGAGWWLLFAAARFLYRDHVGYLRRRKGRCPRCAYDLKHDLSTGCPECGWKRPRADPA